MKNGFTLVELSIVLVIIGLLVGGILVGQSLVDSAKINRLVRDLGQYEIAIKLFEDKFNSYPGDSIYFGVSGDNNGIINDPIGCNGIFANDERYQFWGDLSESKMISETYVGWQPVTGCGGAHTSPPTDPSLSGVTWPGVEHNDRTSTLIAQITPILPQLNGTGENFRLVFAADAMKILAIENKMGTQDFDGTEQQIGLVNDNNSGECIASLSPTVIADCGDSSAVYGVMNLFIQKN